MALYRHVADKNTLLALVANAIAERELVPEAGAGSGGGAGGAAPRGPWQPRLRRLARTLHGELSAYPGLADLLMTWSNHGPAGVRFAELIISTIAESGTDDDATARFYLLFLDLVLGRAHHPTHGDPTTPARNTLVYAAAEDDPAAAPRLSALLPRLRAATPEAVFEAGLDMLVTAIEAAARGSGPGS
jgi:hypothetical protein